MTRVSRRRGASSRADSGRTSKKGHGSTGAQSSRAGQPAGDRPSEAERRWNILEEHRLRQEVTRLDEWRRDRPELWEWTESLRVERNREFADVNERLRAAGCRLVEPEPTLEEKKQKLRDLERLNLAVTAYWGKAR